MERAPWLKYAGYVLLALALVQLAYRSAYIFSYETDIAGIEETFVFYTQRIIDGQSIYIQPDTPPFFLTQYSPLPYYVYAWHSMAWGIDDPLQVHEIYMAGRALNIVLVLISIGMLFYGALRYLNMPVSVALIVAATAFLMFFPHQYALRPDALKTFWITGTLLAYLHYWKRGSLMALWLCALLIALAFVTKQDAPKWYIGIGLLLLAGRHWKALIHFTAAGVVFMALANLIAWQLLGDRFIENMYFGLNQGLNTSYFLFVLLLCLPVFALALAQWFTWYWRKDRTVAPLYGLSLALFCVTAVSTLKFGAAPVYYIDFILVSLLCIGIFLKQERGARMLRTLGMLGVVLLLRFLLGMIGDKVMNGVEEDRRLAAHNEREVVADLFHNETYPLSAGQYILSFDKPLVLHLYGQTVFPSIEAEFVNLLFCTPQISENPNQLYRYEQAQQMIEEGSIRYVILSCPTGWPEFLNLRPEYYYLCREVAGHRIYQHIVYINSEYCQS